MLSVGSPFPRLGQDGDGEGGEDGELVDPTEDASLVAHGYAALTALRGPRADDDRELFALLDEGLAEAVAPLGLAG